MESITQYPTALGYIKARMNTNGRSVYCKRPLSLCSLIADNHCFLTYVMVLTKEHVL